MQSRNMSPIFEIKLLEDTARKVSRNGLHKKALNLRLKALELREKNVGKNNEGYAAALRNISIDYSNLGDFELNVIYAEKSLKVLEQFLDNEEETFYAIVLLAQIYVTKNQPNTAIPLQVRALNIATRLYGFSSNEVAIANSGLARSLSTQGNFSEALVLAKRAVQIAGNKRDRWTLLFLGDLGSILRDSGKLTEALEVNLSALQLALALREKIGSAISTYLNNVALDYYGLGQPDKSLELFLKAKKALEDDSMEGDVYSKLINNIGLAYVAIGETEKGLAFQIRSTQKFEKILGKNHPLFALSLDNLATTYQKLGNYKKALPLQLRAMSINKVALAPNHPSLGLSLNNISDTYLNLGLKDKALSSSEEALIINGRAVGELHSHTADSLHVYGNALYVLARPEAALLMLKSSVNIFQSIRGGVSNLGKSDLLRFTANVQQVYQDLAYMLIEQGRLSEAQQVLDMLKEDEQFEFIRRASDADPRGSRISYTGTEQVWLKRYREIADQLGKLGAEERDLEKQAKLGLTPEQKQRQQAIAADLKVAQKAFQSFLSEMREGLAQKGQARKVEVEEVSDQAMRESQSLIKGLGDDVALLQYYITDKRVGMLLTTPGIQLARSSDIDSKELNRKIGELRRLLQDLKSNPVAAAQDLYRILVAPVAKDLDDSKIKTVMLSLDGALRYLPFGALHDGKQYLVNRWNLPIYTSVTRNKLRESVSPEWQAAGLGVTKAWPEFKPLAGVQAEMGAIVKTAAGGFMPGEVYLDEAFTASRLKDVGQRKFPLMHVASHFRFSPGTEVNSFLLLGDGERLTLGDIRTQNYRFDNVDLLTLSACDTGLGGGRDEQGKEIEGFGVIAQQQGAKAVLATLWPVADQSTATLMADMYRRRQLDSLTKIEALRQSQMAMMLRTKYAHPYYWAPFILMGNWK